MTALDHTTSVFNVDEAKIYLMTADPKSGSPTYSTGIEVPTIQNVALKPDVLAKELYGSGAVQARASKLRQIMVTVDYGILDLDAIALINGSTVTDAGSTPSRTSQLDITVNDIPPYFKLEFRILQTDLVGGSVSVQLHKCKMSDVTLGLAAKEDFAPQAFVLAAIPLKSTGKIASPILNETAAALSS